MSILLLGGTGFIGSELRKSLLKNKIKLISPTKNRLNLKETKKIINYVLRKKITMIINLAGISEVIKNNESQYLNLNLIKVENLLRYLVKIKFTGKFIQMSSAYVYAPNGNTNESSKPTPQNYYALCKLCLDNIIEYYSKDLNCLSLRLFNIIGKQQKSRYLIPSIIRQIKNKNSNEIILNDIKSKRDFSDLRDLCNFLIFIYNYKYKLEPIINFSSGKSYSIKKIVKIMQKLARSTKKINGNNAIKIPTSNYFSKPHKLKKMGFKHKYSLRTTLRDILEKHNVI